MRRGTGTSAPREFPSGARGTHVGYNEGGPCLGNSTMGRLGLRVALHRRDPSTPRLP
jgi:hypothetical protein